MMSPEEYRESIRKLNHEAFILGEKVECPADHPLVIPAQNAVAMIYELAQEPEHQHFMTAVSHITGKRINRFTHAHQSTQDLVNKVKMLRILGQRTGTCFQRCVGMDAINAISSTTYEMDQVLGTEYHQRFLNFLEYVQEKDLVCTGQDRRRPCV